MTVKNMIQTVHELNKLLNDYDICGRTVLPDFPEYGQVMIVIDKKNEDLKEYIRELVQKHLPMCVEAVVRTFPNPKIDFDKVPQ